MIQQMYTVTYSLAFTLGGQLLEPGQANVRVQEDMQELLTGIYGQGADNAASAGVAIAERDYDSPNVLQCHVAARVPAEALSAVEVEMISVLAVVNSRQAVRDSQRGLGLPAVRLTPWGEPSVRRAQDDDVTATVRVTDGEPLFTRDIRALREVLVARPEVSSVEVYRAGTTRANINVVPGPLMTPRELEVLVATAAVQAMPGRDISVAAEKPVSAALLAPPPHPAAVPTRARASSAGVDSTLVGTGTEARREATQGRP